MIAASDPPAASALARRSSRSTLPSTSQATTVTDMPAITALAALVPCADDGMRHTLRPVSPLARWYARSQLVLFPVLRQEPFGLVGVESLAYGKPIVAFAGGAVDEWLWPGETGLRVEGRSADAFAAALPADKLVRRTPAAP